MTGRTMRTTGAARTARRTTMCAVLIAAAPLQRAPAQEPPAYCPALREVAALVHTREKFASIIGRPREGNYLDTTRPLDGWADCAFYGARTYTCDSQPLRSAEDAGRAFERVLDEVKGCLRDGWAEDQGRASPGYAVIRDDRQAASITINTDQTGANEHVVRLILFLRSR
jgi:hypothetical protein